MREERSGRHSGESGHLDKGPTTPGLAWSGASINCHALSTRSTRCTHHGRLHSHRLRKKKAETKRCQTCVKCQSKGSGGKKRQ